MRWQDVVSVALSVLIIILIALLQERSRFIAAVTATMPLKLTLAIWVVYIAVEGERQAMDQFGRGLFMGLLPTTAFVAVVWWGLRAGMKLLPAFVIGYLVWGIGVVLISGLRQWGGYG